jgi:hypothetical protein
MASDLELEIQRHLSKYLETGALSEFEDWLIPSLWDLSESHDEGARELAGSISNVIAEFSLGDRTFESFREKLDRLALPFVVPEEPLPVRIVRFAETGSYGDSKPIKSGKLSEPTYQGPRQPAASRFVGQTQIESLDVQFALTIS